MPTSSSQSQAVITKLALRTICSMRARSSMGRRGPRLQERYRSITSSRLRLLPVLYEITSGVLRVGGALLLLAGLRRFVLARLHFLRLLHGPLYIGIGRLR